MFDRINFQIHKNSYFLTFIFSNNLSVSIAALDLFASAWTSYKTKFLG